MVPTLRKQFKSLFNLLPMKSWIYFILVVVLQTTFPKGGFALQQNSKPEIIDFLVKDTAQATRIKNGHYEHPAIEIAMKADYKATTKRAFPIRVAIDPGHIATNKKEAILEERFMNTKSGFFFESELTMATATILKDKLERRGFEVMITRESGATALGTTYTHWYKKVAKKELKAALERGEIKKEKYEELINADPKELFNKYYKDKDFLARRDKINAFQPDVTLIIHYNATEFKNNDKSYAPEVDYNYSVAFVPGGFTNQELRQESQLEDFIKLASTDIITNSIKLSSLIVDEFDRKLGAPKLKPTDLPDLWYLKKYSVYTGTPGVFSRNLFLTRAINSPVCYGEATLQNYSPEIKLLSERNLKTKKGRISSRVVDVADCFYTGTIKYFETLGWLK